jgi:hypothetical protein
MLRVIAATSGGTWETLAATYRRRTGRQLADGAAVATLKRLDDRKLVARAWRGRRLHYLPLT